MAFKYQAVLHNSRNHFLMDIKAAMLSANSLFKGFLNKTHKPKSSGALTAALQEKYNQPGKEEKAKKPDEI